MNTLAAEATIEKPNQTVPFVDLSNQYRQMSKEIDTAAREVMMNASFILGSRLEEFENRFAAYCHSKFCVGVASGGEALHLALKALGIKSGDEVITVANTFVATLFAISYAGATPVLVDIDPKTYNMDLSQLEDKITPRTKAVIPVHLYGQPVRMDILLQIALKHNLKIVEDACQAHGATHGGQRAGSFGSMGCFSFYPGKNLGAYGDGGAIVTSDETLYEKLKILRNYGSKKKYHHEVIGFNSRLDTLQAAVLDVKLKYLDEWNEKRLKNALLYHHLLGDVEEIVTPEIDPATSHVFHLYVVRVRDRDKLMDYLNRNGIQCGIHYPVPVYALDAYAGLGLSGDAFPVTHRFSREILSLPMYPELTANQIETVTSQIKRFYENIATH